MFKKPEDKKLKDKLFDKIQDSLLNDSDKWDVSGSYAEDYKLRNRINNFILKWNGVNYYGIIEPKKVQFIGWKYRPAKRKIKELCKKHDEKVSVIKWTTLNNLWDSKYTIRLSYKILKEFGTKKQLWKTKINNFSKSIDECAIGKWDWTFPLHHNYDNSIVIYFKEEADLAFMILKWSKFIV